MLYRQLVERNPLEPGTVLAPIWIWVSLLFSVRVTWRILITFLLTNGLWMGCQFCFVIRCSSKVWKNQFSYRQEPKDMPEPRREFFPKWVSRVRFQCMDTAGVGWRERWSARLNPKPLGHLRKPGRVWQFVQTARQACCSASYDPIWPFMEGHFLIWLQAEPKIWATHRLGRGWLLSFQHCVAASTRLSCHQTFRKRPPVELWHDQARKDTSEVLRLGTF